MPEGNVSGRTKIRMSALKISNNDDDNNCNGINWVKQYVEDNLDSIIGASYKVCFVDDDKTIPSGHGQMKYDNDGNVIFPDSDTVGTILSAEVNTMDMDGESCEVLLTEGYLYEQSYPNFVKWLHDEIKNGTVYGSVEINGKSKSKTITYETSGIDDKGNPLVGRKPKVFDFTALAILSDIIQPADFNSRVVELNNKQKEGAKMADKTVEINELSYDDIATLIVRAFSKAMPANRYGDYYWLYKMYPQSGRAIFVKEWDTPYIYYMCTYSLSNTTVTIGEITEVEQDWKPVNNEQAVEVNSDAIKKKLKESTKMDENKISELNQTIEANTKTINDLTSKNSELNETVVTANKKVEELNATITNLTAELNTVKGERDTLKTEKETVEIEKHKAEVNSYFETEIPKNGFSETEINSLKHFVEEVNLAGLKTAESELCAKKFKEMIAGASKEEEVETNSANFIAFHDKGKKDISKDSPTWFREA